MSYNPLVPPQDPEQLLQYINDEFGRVATALAPLQNGEFGISHVLPNKVRPGMWRIFDGVDADPLGTGLAGIYWYGEDNLWHYAG